MTVAGLLGKVLSLVEDLGRPVIDLTSDRAFQDGGVDEGRGRVNVGWLGASGTILDQHAFHALARDIRQGLVKHDSHLGQWCCWLCLGGMCRQDR